MNRILLSFLFTFMAFASENDLIHRPRSFYSSFGKAVFVDFQTAIYDIQYDITNKQAHVVARIQFHAIEAGHPVFDSVTAPARIVLNGRAVTATEVRTPQYETTVRVLSQSVSTGKHLMEISLPLTEMIEFRDGSVRSAFWTSDLDERNFLERYLPANFEFDQVRMTFNLTFKGLTVPQSIYSNGVVKKISTHQYQINFPAYYTSSSVYFHTMGTSAAEELRFSLKSIDGRIIPAVVYFLKSHGSDLTLNTFKNRITEIFHELEKDYGAFPHPGIVVYNAGSGGMEYCGATMTDSWALGHELFHSYFARGVMPANGNTGWVDEALASWRDDDYPRVTTLSGGSIMSSHPYYTRTTDTDAYTFGAEFMSYLDYKLADQGGLKPFLRHLIEKKTFKPFFVEEFIQEMGLFYGKSLEAEFKKYTYGKNRVQKTNYKKSHRHQKMSIQELRKFL